MSSAIDPADHRDQLGNTVEYEFGVVTRLHVRRYARAVEDDNPLYRDVAYAREQGYDDLVVPPNFLPAIIEYEGAPVDHLREDGTDPEAIPIDLPPKAILMGGGQQLTFNRYATAGESISMRETFSDLYQKADSGGGVLTFLELHKEYFANGDEKLVNCKETIIVGDRP